jgi:hypothetical protein
MVRASSFRPSVGLPILLAALCFASAGWPVSSPFQAVLVDLEGNRHEVTQFTYHSRTEFEYYVGSERRVVPFQEIDRIRFDGEPGAEEQEVLVSLRSGRQERGIFATGAGITPHQDAEGGGGEVAGFSGNTSLGPFFRRAGQVREVILRHPDGEGLVPERVLKATVVTEDGNRFEVDGLRCRGGFRFDYRIGQRERFADLFKVARIDFDEGHLEDEWRPATITFWSGKKVVGEVDAGTVRLAGETDKAYYDRVSAALTGNTSVGIFSVGMRAVRQIRFVQGQTGAEKGGAAPDSSESPPPTAPPPEATSPVQSK